MRHRALLKHNIITHVVIVSPLIVIFDFQKSQRDFPIIIFNFDPI